MEDQDTISNNRRIAKNTLMLYIRMFAIIIVSIYTSRITLYKLGVCDYGLINSVGGAIGIISFINATLSIGTSRFITYALGTKDLSNINKTFNTTLYTHIFLGVIIIFILETLGIWFVSNKLIIPHDRINASFIVFHISTISTFISIISVPYNSLIMAYEHMKIYAKISIFEAIFKLIVVYLLCISPLDKMVTLCILNLCVSIIFTGYRILYCNNNLYGCNLKLTFDRNIFKSLISFSSWNILANITETLKAQGIIILINMFFQPTIVAAQTIATQLSSSIMQFIQNFRLAINPQIIKLFASRNFNKSKELTIKSTIYLFDLLLMLAIPLFVFMEEILNLWLVTVPYYTVIFAKCMIIQNVVGHFDASFYIPLMASGRIQLNSKACALLSITQFILLYYLLNKGQDVVWIQYITIIFTSLFSFLIKPYCLYKSVDYTIQDFIRCYIPCIKVLFTSILIILVFVNLFNPKDLVSKVCFFLWIEFSIVISSLIYMEDNIRKLVLNKLKYKLLKLK